MKVSANNGGGFQSAAPGTYRAVCTRVIDLGTQTVNSKNGPKQQRRVSLGFELDEHMEDGRPFYASAEFNATIYETSFLGKFLTGWRGVAFTQEEQDSFDLQTILGKSCLLTLVKDGQYTNINGAVKLIKGTAPLAAVGELLHLDLDNFNRAVFEKLHEKMRAKIAKSPEYDKAVGNAPPAGDGHKPASDDDIPF